MQISNIDQLIYPVVEGNTTIRYYVTKEEIFDILKEAHIDTEHGGRNRMYKEVQKKYKNITQEHISLYLGANLAVIEIYAAVVDRASYVLLTVIAV